MVSWQVTLICVFPEWTDKNALLNQKFFLKLKDRFLNKNKMKVHSAHYPMLLIPSLENNGLIKRHL